LEQPFFIVACVNQSSAEVLAEQIRIRLARRQTLRDSGLESEISFSLLDTRSTRNKALSEELMNRDVVDRIEALMKTVLGKGEGGLNE
jgi:hypothetical protein